MEKIIIDTDIGDDIDDAYAIALSILTKELEVLGVTTVYRNAIQRAKIVKYILRLLNKNEVEVVAGEDFPLKTEIFIFPFDKMFDKNRPVIPHYSNIFENEIISKKNAEDYILEMANKYPKQVTLLAIGPMTNLAKAAKKDIKSFQNLKQIVCMGGQSLGSFAEWNIRCDAESANIVFLSGVNIKMIGIDVTKLMTISKSDEKILSEGSDFRCLVGKMLKKWHNDFPTKIATMHDVLTAAEITEHFCEYKTCGIKIPLEGKKRAFTIPIKGNNIEIAVKVNKNKFMNYFTKKILEENNNSFCSNVNEIIFDN